MTTLIIPNNFVNNTTADAEQVDANFEAVRLAVVASMPKDGSDPMTGALKAASGTAALPGVAFDGDADTGIYRKAANELGFSTNGTLRGHFDSAGKLVLAGDADVAGAVAITGAATITGAAAFASHQEIAKIAEPASPAANKLRIYAVDVAGITRLATKDSAGTTGVALLSSGNLADLASAATAFTNIKQAASDTATGVLEIAVQSEMETPSSTTLAVTPARQHFHPGHPKFWVRANVTGGVPAIANSYNVTSVTDTGVGQMTTNIATDFSSADWCAQTSNFFNGFGLISQIGAMAAGTIQADAIVRSNGNLSDPDAWNVSGMGDQ